MGDRELKEIDPRKLTDAELCARFWQLLNRTQRFPVDGADLVEFGEINELRKERGLTCR